MFEFRVANNLDSNTKFMFSMDEINPKENIYINFLDNKITNSNYLNFSSQELTNFNSNLERLKDQTVIWHKKGYNIIFYLSKENNDESDHSLLLSRLSYHLILQYEENSAWFSVSLSKMDCLIFTFFLQMEFMHWQQLL